MKGVSLSWVVEASPSLFKKQNKKSSENEIGSPEGAISQLGERLEGNETSCFFWGGDVVLEHNKIFVHSK